MPVLSSSIDPNSGTQVSSPYGPGFWYPTSTNIQTSVNPDGGAGWMIYQLKGSGLPPADVVNGVRIQGGLDFLVGGGAGTGRNASALWRMGHSTADFIGAAYDGVITYVPGSGVGTNVNFVAAKAGFTGADINNGTMYIGFSCGSDNGNPGVGMGAGVFRNSCFAWITYTGADQPTPPATSTLVTVSNPAGNNSPGKTPGQQFAALDLTLVQVQPQTSFQFRMQLPGGMTWAANGAGFIAVLKGTANTPGDPYHHNTGLINTSSSIAPGKYTFEVLTTGGSLIDSYMNIPLTVLGPNMATFGFHEF